MVYNYSSVHLYFTTDESGLCNFAKKRLMTNVINECNSTLSVHLKKDFSYEILFLKTTIDLKVNFKYVKLQQILHKMYEEKKKQDIIMLYIFGQ